MNPASRMAWHPPAARALAHLNEALADLDAAIAAAPGGRHRVALVTISDDVRATIQTMDAEALAWEVDRHLTDIENDYITD